MVISILVRFGFLLPIGFGWLVLLYFLGAYKFRDLSLGVLEHRRETVRAKRFESDLHGFEIQCTSSGLGLKY